MASREQPIGGFRVMYCTQCERVTMHTQRHGQLRCNAHAE